MHLAGRARGRAHDAPPEREVPEPEQGGQACGQAAAQPGAAKREAGPGQARPPALARRRYGLQGGHRGATSACWVHWAEDDGGRPQHAGSRSPHPQPTDPSRCLTRQFTPGLSPPLLPVSITWQGATSLLAHIKAHVAKDAPGPAVPKRVAMQILLRIKQVLEAKDESLSELQFDTGRLVIVGDTHGQINDFCWILRSHGLPAPGNMYLINGDVADRGKNAVEILLCIYAFMLAAPGTIHMNRGNHESIDMNVRSFREGGGFAVEVGGKYGSDVFTLFQARSHALHTTHITAARMSPRPHARTRASEAPDVLVTCGPSWFAQDVFSLLPLAARVNKEVLVLHGGLCRTGTATIEQMKAIDRRRPVPVSTNDPKDVLFFDTMWADPQASEGFGSSAARGAGCVTFGPDVTRRFCEINRLRMIVRSHEVPKTMTGVQAH